MSNWKKTMSSNRPLLIIPVMVLLCLALPFLEKVGSALASPWEKLPASPSRPVELLGTGRSDGTGVGIIEGADGVVHIQGDVYIQVEDGQVYNYEEGFRTWRPGETEHIAEAVNCESTGSLWWRKQGECLQAGEENGPRHYFLLDQDGIIWHRRDSAILPTYELCGLIGLAVGIGIVFWKWLFHQPGPGMVPAGNFTSDKQN